MLQANVNIGFNAHRRNSPCVLSPSCQLLFFFSLMSHPFDVAFYYGELIPTPCRVPNGVKARRQANALARINTADFHIRNNSIGRLWTLNTMEMQDMDHNAIIQERIRSWKISLDLNDVMPIL